MTGGTPITTAAGLRNSSTNTRRCFLAPPVAVGDGRRDRGKSPWALLGGLLVALALNPGCGRGSKSSVPSAAAPDKAGQTGVADPAKQAGSPDKTAAGSSVSEAPDAAGAASTSNPPPQGAPDAHPGDAPANVASPDGEATLAVLPERKLFEGWESPQVVLLVTGQQHGYIEPCGCTQLANQKGGLARRHTLARQLTERGWPLVGLDAGNQVRRFGRQAEIKFHMTLDGLQTIGYDAIVLGVDDLRLSADELVAATVPLEGRETPFLCANAAVLDWSLMKDHTVIKRGETRIGVTAILGAEFGKEVARDDVVFKAPGDGLREVLPKLQAADCDLLVLLAHAPVAEAKKLAREFPQFDIVVAAGGRGDGTDPLYQAEAVDGTDAMFVRTGSKGMFAGVIGVFDDPETQLRYQRVPLDASYEDSPQMLDLLASYQDQLESLGLSGLGLQPVAHSSGHKFVGSEKCGECHFEAFEIWSQTPHAHATESLVNPVERAAIPRHYDPECLSCHVTGWNPQRYFPYTSGYLDLERSAALHGNGCENCHGPGSAHVDAESGTAGADESTVTALRKAMRLPLAKAENKCVQCHDIDNSPNFHEEGAYEHYLEEIKHW